MSTGSLASGVGAKLAVLVSVLEAVPLAVWLVPYSNMAKRRIIVWLSQSKNFARYASIAGVFALVYHSFKLFKLLWSRKHEQQSPIKGKGRADVSKTVAMETDPDVEAMQARVDLLVEGIMDSPTCFSALAATPGNSTSTTPKKPKKTRVSPTSPPAVASPNNTSSAGSDSSSSPSSFSSSSSSSLSLSSPSSPSSSSSSSWMLQVYQNVFGILLGLFTRRVMWLLKGNEEALFQMEQNAVERDILRFKPPSLRRLETVLKPYEMTMRPKFLGMEQIPDDRPLLFVSNHTIMGFDYPLLLTELYRRKGIFLRVLADHSHFQIPINADILQNVLGAVDGTRRNTELLMGQKQCVFVYPGGARETFKRTTDKKYELIWGDRMGFVKMALRHGCTIVPVVNVGTEDITRIHYDLPIGWLPVPFLYGSDRTVPVFTPDVSQLQRLYFYFAQPIHVGKFVPKSMSPVEASEDPNICTRIRDATRTAIEEGISFLKAYREYDPDRMTSAKTNRKEAIKLARWIIRRSKKERKPSDLGDALGAEEDDSNEEDDDDEEDENNTGRETGGKNEEARRQARELHEWYLRTSRM